MAAIPSYRAEMVGLSERDRTLLRSLLAATQARTGRRWDGGPGQQQVYFIDIDGQAGAEFWQSLVEDERRDSAIVLSSAPPTAATHWLPKPLRSVSLLGVLEQMTLPARAPATPTTGAGPAASAPAAARVRNANEPLALLDVFNEPPANTARCAIVTGQIWSSAAATRMSCARRPGPLRRIRASVTVDRVAKYSGGPLSDELRMDLDTLRWLACCTRRLARSSRLPRPERARLRTCRHSVTCRIRCSTCAWPRGLRSILPPQELAGMTGDDDETVLRSAHAKRSACSRKSSSRRPRRSRRRHSSRNPHPSRNPSPSRSLKRHRSYLRPRKLPERKASKRFPCYPSRSRSRR